MNLESRCLEVGIEAKSQTPPVVVRHARVQVVLEMVEMAKGNQDVRRRARAPAARPRAHGALEVPSAGDPPCRCTGSTRRRRRRFKSSTVSEKAIAK